MKSGDVFDLAIFAAALAVLVTVVAIGRHRLNDDIRACSERGGVPVESRSGVTCMAPSSVIRP